MITKEQAQQIAIDAFQNVDTWEAVPEPLRLQIEDALEKEPDLRSMDIKLMIGQFAMVNVLMGQILSLQDHVQQLSNAINSHERAIQNIVKIKL